MVEQKLLSLQDETSLITGGSRGIGKAIALEFARAGSAIYFVSRGDTPDKESEALQTAAEIKALGVKSVWIKADVAKDEGIEAILQKIEGDETLVNVFVNNAGYPFNALAESNSAEALDNSYRLNLRAPVLLAGELKRQRLFADSASIIFIASIIGESPNVGQINYGTMKAGLRWAARQLAEEWGADGIRVNSISPGMVKTELTADLPAAVFPILKDLTPLNRLGEPEDVARVALFLACNELSAFVTGVDLVVDGGLGGKVGAAFPFYEGRYRKLTPRQMRDLNFR